jgi:hypothetical protein
MKTSAAAQQTDKIRTGRARRVPILFASIGGSYATTTGTRSKSGIKLEWFCRGITNAMHKPLISSEELRRREGGAAQSTNDKQPGPGVEAAGRAELDEPARGMEKIAAHCCCAPAILGSTL